MVSKTITVKNEQGFHMRPAMEFVNTITKYPCDVKIKTKDKEIDGRSVMNLIAAGIRCGTQIEVICNGENEQQALEAATRLIDDGFGE